MVDSTTMSGIRFKTEITDNEKKAIQNQATLYPEKTGLIVHHDQMNPKLLLNILEVLQDIKQELTHMRQTNERMAAKMDTVFTGGSIKVQTTN